MYCAIRHSCAKLHLASPNGVPLAHLAHLPSCIHQPILVLCWMTQLWTVQVDTSRVEVAVSIPRSAGEGLLWLETECAGVLSEPAPLVLTDDLDVAEELQSLKEGATACQVLSVAHTESLLVDVGMTLQYAGYLFGSGASSGHTGEAGPLCSPVRHSFMSGWGFSTVSFRLGASFICPASCELSSSLLRVLAMSTQAAHELFEVVTASRG